MPDINSTFISPDFKNPFTGPEREKVWQELKENATPISRDKVLRRAEELRKKSIKR
jgi:hypothetical protein|tara:strand:- start:6500 stop:6667 length:168 start_codon:yes stop_codon:yes gene_type:complete